LHGVHRPVAMKKAIIKRRKRVVPASQGTQASGIDGLNNTMGSPESDGPSPTADPQDQRGSINPDGSINLGLRLRNQPGRTVLPEPISTNRGQNGQQPPLSSNLTAYVSTTNNQAQSLHNLESLNNENRLPPMASYPSPTQRHQSLSPNSVLSASRKRSFSELETRAEANSIAEQSSSVNSKRLSSIKSILNPGFLDSETGDADPHLRPTVSPGPMNSRYSPSPASSVAGSALNSGRDVQSESERARLERREMLQREADRMREALRAKERELAELAENE
jgi:GATA-binding protein